MPRGLVRYQHTGQSHFLTFSCSRREAKLADPQKCALLLRSVERIRNVYGFYVYGYVIMPEHVHLLISEPRRKTLAVAIQALKVSFDRQLSVATGAKGNFWQKRYYDHNVRDFESFMEKLRYIHRNPVKRGLCARAVDYQWSSCRHYAYGEMSVVEIESQWTAARRQGREPNVLIPT